MRVQDLSNSDLARTDPASKVQQLRSDLQNSRAVHGGNIGSGRKLQEGAEQCLSYFS